MKRFLPLLLLIPLLAFAQVTTNPGVTGVASSPSNVAITGGTINGTVIGGTTPAAISGTTGAFSGSITVPSGTFNGQIIGRGDNGQVLSATNGANSDLSIAIATGVTSIGSSVGAIQIKPSGTLVGNFTSTGLAVTGTLSATGAVTFSGLSSDAATNDSTACVTTSTGVITKGSGTLGICLGTSSERYKTQLVPLDAGLTEVMALRPVSYHLDKDHGDPGKMLYGFTAEQGGKVLPQLMGLDTDGRPNTFDYLGIVPVLVKAIQEQQVQINRLKKEVAALKPNGRNALYTKYDLQRTIH